MASPCSLSIALCPGPGLPLPHAPLVHLPGESRVQAVVDHLAGAEAMPLGALHLYVLTNGGSFPVRLAPAERLAEVFAAFAVGQPRVMTIHYATAPLHGP
jgi:hypothetical protein